MKDQSKMGFEKLYEGLFWFENWLPQSKDLFGDQDQDHYTIYQELTANWRRQNPITLLNALQERFGLQVKDVLERIVATNVPRDWVAVARQRGSNTIEDLIQVLWEPLIPKGFEYTLEKRDDGVQMSCTRCPFYELGRALNGTEWLYYLVCLNDLYIVEGFNPNMGFRRTKTLMEGHECCDHFYFMKNRETMV
jgi:predicted ArsR family transcriptional regulator